MKQLTFNGRGRDLLVVPGREKPLTAGEACEISNDLAEQLAAQNLPITITDAPSKAAQPEAHEGEGQPTANKHEEE